MKLTPDILDIMIKDCLEENNEYTQSLNESQKNPVKTSNKLTPQILKRMLKEELKKKTYEWVLLPPPS